MKYYRHTDGSVYAFEDDGSQDGFITPDMAPMSQYEVDAHIYRASIPQSVTMRQARLALLGAGHLVGVDAAIAAIPDDMQRQAAQIEWEYAQTVDRNAPFTQTLATALGLSDADLDALFTAAAAL